MKELLKATVAFAALALSVSAGAAHPSFDPACTILNRNHQGIHLTLALDKPSCTATQPCLEAVDLNANPLGLAGEVTLTCRADNLGNGPLTILTFANTQDTCDLGTEAAPFAKTQVWQEVINAVGEAVLTCVFPFPTVTPH